MVHLVIINQHIYICIYVWYHQNLLTPSCSTADNLPPVPASRLPSTQRPAPEDSRSRVSLVPSLSLITSPSRASSGEATVQMPADERGQIWQAQMRGLWEDVKNHGPFLRVKKERESQDSFS